MPVSLEKTERGSVPGAYTEDQVRVELGFPTRAQLQAAVDMDRLRDAFRRAVPALRSLAPVLSEFHRNMGVLVGGDPSVSPDAMRWTPQDGEVPRWPV